VKVEVNPQNNVSEVEETKAKHKKDKFSHIKSTIP
jgi:hypothetical protein